MGSVKVVFVCKTELLPGNMLCVRPALTHWWQINMKTKGLNLKGPNRQHYSQMIQNIQN